MSNDVDFIQSQDPTVETAIIYQGTSRREMPDKRKDILFDDGAHVVNMEFAESALFAYVLRKHPDGLPVDLRASLTDNIPHRIAYLNEVIDSFDKK